MKIERILYDYPQIPEKVLKLNDELNFVVEAREQSRNTLRTAVITDMPCGTKTANPALDTVEKIIDQYDVQIEFLSQKINELINYKFAVDKALYDLSFEEYRVIDLKYFNGLKMDEVCKEMKCSKRQCYRVLDEALAKISTNMPESS